MVTRSRWQLDNLKGRISVTSPSEFRSIYVYFQKRRQPFRCHPTAPSGGNHMHFMCVWLDATPCVLRLFHRTLAWLIYRHFHPRGFPLWGRMGEWKYRSTHSKLGTIWMWVVSFTFWLLYPSRRTLIGRLTDLKRQSACCVHRRWWKVLPPPGFEHRRF